MRQGSDGVGGEGKRSGGEKLKKRKHFQARKEVAMAPVAGWGEGGGGCGQGISSCESLEMSINVKEGGAHPLALCQPLPEKLLYVQHNAWITRDVSRLS